MRFLVVGLGSMGKRRIRCLQALGHKEIAGFDQREDRRAEVSRLGAAPYSEFEAAMADFKPEALIISVPPDVHHIYVDEAIARRVPFFVEASVLDTGMEQAIISTRKTGIVAAPSATLCFHPAIRRVAEIVRSGRLGRTSNLVVHTGQYLPDWHPYEHVSEFYVSNPATGGAREIVPFELTWITHIFGFPKSVTGHARKTIEIEGAPKIDDTYNLLLDYGSFLGVLTVDVVSRYAMRRVLINGEAGQLVWEWDKNCVRVYDADSKQWQELSYAPEKALAGYNPNIGEQMYIAEIRAFTDAIEGVAPFPNTLEEDLKVLRLMYAAERSSEGATA